MNNQRRNKFEGKKGNGHDKVDDDDDNNNATGNRIQQQQQQQQQQQRTRRPRSNNNNLTNKNKNHTSNNINNTMNNKNIIIGKVLLLHGNRQTGQLLLGRIERLRKKLLLYCSIEIITIDAPHIYLNENNNNTNTPPTTTTIEEEEEEPTVYTWWYRSTTTNTANTSINEDDNNNHNTYIGLEQSIEAVRKKCIESQLNDNIPIIGMIGFSQGARFVHLLTLLKYYIHDSNHYNNNNNNNNTELIRKKDYNFLNNLQFVIMVAGYDAPIPSNLFPKNINNNNHSIQYNFSKGCCTIPSLHVCGIQDQLITKQQSIDVAYQYYTNPIIHIHDGGHHVPMRANDIQIYLNFIQQHLRTIPSSVTTNTMSASTTTTTATSMQKKDDNNDNNNDNHNKMLHTSITDNEPVIESVNYNDDDTVLLVPDEECDIQQRDEIQALQSIYENEFHLLSKTTTKEANNDDYTDNTDIIYQYPISFMIDIYPINNSNEKNDHPVTTIIPPLSLHVTYPLTYPNNIPILSLVYTNDSTKLYESKYTIECLNTIHTTIIDEIGMPCIMTCIVSAREYFDSIITTICSDEKNNNFDTLNDVSMDIADNNIEQITNSEDKFDEDNDPSIKAASADRIQVCIEQGLDIANIILSKSTSFTDQLEQHDSTNNSTGNFLTKNNGGSWMFTIGLVGKPSAGKSTFFNTATGFARQRQTDNSNNNSSNDVEDKSNTVSIGGAAMAAHPFTTISPNVGYCYVPAPTGSCPEDTIIPPSKNDITDKYCIGSTHGRDNSGRRLLPVLLKDVAGLVPGAYQGRGRGNQFLNDLCDADVLIHICDASGLSDTDGNIIHSDPLAESITARTNDSSNGISNPLNDMAWIRNELIEWVYSNLIRKWDTIRRKGRSKLEGMFSGYGQTMAVTCNLLNAVEKYMTQLDLQRFINPYEQIDEWDTGDIYRLVSAFLGVRFPIAIALNKMDVPSSTNHIEQIINALPIHGTHVATPLSAKREMLFVRHHIESTMSNTSPLLNDIDTTKVSIPRGTWDCLQSAIQLGNPILVFPVVDHQSYAPLPGLFRYATTDPSLPSRGMIECIKAAGGVAPSEWDEQLHQYTVPKMNGNKKKAVQTTINVQLRDAIMMKPGSTIYDVFLTLKKLGALSGEYIRAEAAGEMFVLPKPVTKFHIVSKNVRIIKIMTNKRNAWQST